MTLTEKLEELRSAGFRIEYADPADVYQYGRIGAVYLHPMPYSDAERPFVIVDGATGECSFDQSPVYVRSNFRSLQRDYGLALVEVGYSNTDGLGFFVHSVSNDLIGTVIGLKVEYPIYDESDWSDLENEEITASFGQYAYADWRNATSEEWTEIADLFTETEVEAAFWDAADAAHVWPEHDGRDVLWTDDTFAECVEAALCALIAAQYGPVQSETLV